MFNAIRIALLLIISIFIILIIKKSNIYLERIQKVQKVFA